MGESFWWEIKAREEFWIGEHMWNVLLVTASDRKLQQQRWNSLCSVLRCDEIKTQWSLFSLLTKSMEVWKRLCVPGTWSLPRINGTLLAFSGSERDKCSEKVKGWGLRKTVLHYWFVCDESSNAGCQEGTQNEFRAVPTVKPSIALEPELRLHITGLLNDYCKFVSPV